MDSLVVVFRALVPIEELEIPVEATLVFHTTNGRRYMTLVHNGKSVRALSREDVAHLADYASRLTIEHVDPPSLSWTLSVLAGLLADSAASAAA